MPRRLPKEETREGIETKILNPLSRDAPKPTQEFIKEEIIDVARKMGAAGLSLLVIDSENQFVSTGFASEIATNAGGKYYYLPNANDRQVRALQPYTLTLRSIRNTCTLHPTLPQGLLDRPGAGKACPSLLIKP